MLKRPENLGRSYGIPSGGARGANARYERMRPISGETKGADTPRGVYYNEKCGPLRSGMLGARMEQFERLDPPVGV